MQDLAAGVGTVAQSRNGLPVTVNKVDVPFAVLSVAEMQALDIAKYKFCRVLVSSTNSEDYRYSATSTNGYSSVSTGTWVRVGLLEANSVTALRVAKVDWSDYVGKTVYTVVHNTTSNDGGSEYLITNVNPSNLATLISGVWIGANHDLGGGFYAKLVDKGNIYCYGLINAGDGNANMRAIEAAIYNNNGLVNLPNNASVNFAGSGIVVGSGTGLTNIKVNLRGSTLTRTAFSAVSSNFMAIIGNNKPNLYIQGGTIDNANLTANFTHLIWFDNADGELDLNNVTLKNNLLGGATPTAAQDIDLLYVDKCKKLTVKRCTFDKSSRQGISLTGACPDVLIKDSTLSNNYLFGIDIEPNTSVSKMFKRVVITGNIFENNGNKSTTNHVWGPSFGNGPLRVLSGNPAVTIIDKITFSNNIIISSDFLNAVGGWQAPSFGITQYNHLIMKGNVFQNMSFINISVDASNTAKSTTITGNETDFSVGTLLSNWNVYFSDRTVFNNNDISYLRYSGSSTNIEGNTFTTTNSYCLQPRADSGQSVILGNTVQSAGSYFIDTTLKSTEMFIGFNNTKGLPISSPNTNLAVPRAGNSDGVVKAPTRYEGVLTTLSIASGAAPVTVFNMLNTNFIGIITVRDYGTRTGSAGNFANFSDGTNNSNHLYNVQNSPLAGSALTISGSQIQFAHTFGSTRQFSINVVSFA